MRGLGYPSPEDREPFSKFLRARHGAGLSDACSPGCPGHVRSEGNHGSRIERCDDCARLAGQTDTITDTDARDFRRLLKGSR